MISHPLETKSDLKKYSVGYVVNQFSNDNISNERTKHVGSTSPTINNILNKNGNITASGVETQDSNVKKNHEAPKIFSSRGMLLPTTSDINGKPATTILGNPSNERSYILTNHSNVSKSGLGSNNATTSTQNGDGLSPHTDTSSTDRNDSLHQEDSSEKQTVTSGGAAPANPTNTMSQYTLTQVTTGSSADNKLKPLDIPPHRRLSGQGPLATDSRLYGSVPSIPYTEGTSRVIYSGATPSSLPTYGRANSAFVGGTRRGEEVQQYFTVANAQYSQPAPEQHLGSRNSYYSRSSNNSIPDGVMYANGRVSRYNSVDSNSGDMDMSNRLPHFDRIQPLVDPRQQYYSTPYRMDENQSHVTFPPGISGSKYNRHNTAPTIPGSVPGAGVYHHRQATSISGVIPAMYQEQASADSSMITPAYDKYPGRVLSGDYAAHAPNPYSNGMYSYGPAVQGAPPLLQFQQQQAGQYPYPMVINQQGSPHYGKMLNHLHKKKINQCNICGKILTRPSSLHSHMFVHTGDRPYVCKWPNCGKTFNVKSNMNRHYKLHLKRQVIDDKLGLKTMESKDLESSDMT